MGVACGNIGTMKDTCTDESTIEEKRLLVTIRALQDRCIELTELVQKLETRSNQDSAILKALSSALETKREEAAALQKESVETRQLKEDLEKTRDERSGVISDRRRELAKLALPDAVDNPTWETCMEALAGKLSSVSSQPSAIRAAEIRLAAVVMPHRKETASFGECLEKIREVMRPSKSPERAENELEKNDRG